MFSRKAISCLVVLFSLNTLVASQSKRESVRIYGTIVAYTSAWKPLTVAPGSQTLIVRVDHQRQTQIKDPYVLIDYTYFGDEPVLPQEMLNGNRIWRFLVSRSTTNDLKPKDISIGTVELETGKEISRESRLIWLNERDKIIAENKILTGYELQSGDYSLVKK